MFRESKVVWCVGRKVRVDLEKCGVPSLILVISAQLQAFPLFQVIPCASRDQA